MNLKQGKTEALLFETSKKTTQNTEDFEIYANNSKISVTKNTNILEFLLIAPFT